jgi:hypothetical protein
MKKEQLKNLKFGDRIEVASRRGFCNDYLFVCGGKLFTIYSEELDQVHKCSPCQVRMVYSKELNK